MRDLAPKRLNSMLLAFLAGGTATVAAYGIAKALVAAGHRGATTFNTIPVTITLFLLAGFWIGAQLAPFTRQQAAASFRAVISCFFAANGGIAAGVLFWAVVVDDLVLQHLGRTLYEEHNLFPFEILILWTLAAIPLIGGMLGGRAVDQFRKHLAAEAQSR